MRKIALFLLVIVILAVMPVRAENIPQIDRKTVNGMTILLQKTDSKLAEVTLLLKSGSGLDGDKKGIAELMNNLVYLKLNYASEELGEIDIATLPDFTRIQITTSAKDVRDVLQEIRELLTYPLYSYDIIADLKQLYSSEIKGMSPFAKTYAEFNKNFYGVDHPYNNQFNLDVFKSISGQDVYQWYRQTYQPGNAILSISGGIKQNINDLAKYFSGMLSETVDRRLLIKPVVLDQNKLIDSEDPNGRIATFCMGYAAPQIFDPEYPAFRLLTFYLENYQHYFDEIRVKKALFYTAFVNYSYLELPQAPNIMFLTMTEPANIPLVEIKTKEIVDSLINKGMEQSLITEISEAMENQGKSAITAGKGAAARNAMSFYLQSQMVYDENLWPKLKQLTPDDIKKAAAKYFSHYVRVAYIPKSEAENF